MILLFSAHNTLDQAISENRTVHFVRGGQTSNGTHDSYLSAPFHQLLQMVVHLVNTHVDCLHPLALLAVRRATRNERAHESLSVIDNGVSWRTCVTCWFQEMKGGGRENGGKYLACSTCVRDDYPEAAGIKKVNSPAQFFPVFSGWLELRHRSLSELSSLHRRGLCTCKTLNSSAVLLAPIMPNPTA